MDEGRRNKMNITVRHGARYGVMEVPASKSQAHRLLICAALSEEKSLIYSGQLSKDIKATIDCLNALGADIVRTGEDVLNVTPIVRPVSRTAVLNCGESGSTLRFLIPVAGACGINSEFRMEGRLPWRPVDELIRVCGDHGMEIEKSGCSIFVSGKLGPGEYEIDGRISSQYITGLLFALPLLRGNSSLRITGGVESSEYIKMTEDVLIKCGVSFEKKENVYTIPGQQKYSVPSIIQVEKDWSGAAFPLIMGAFSEKGVCVPGMDLKSIQGDKKILDILRGFGADVLISESGITVRKGELKGQIIDASDIPDLVPVVCVAAAGARGVTRIVNASRLRLKESDRIKSTADMIKSLGGHAEETEDGLIIHGTGSLKGGTVDSYGDHRIAMSAAAAAGICTGEVEITDAGCTEKSFPDFWKKLEGTEVEK